MTVAAALLALMSGCTRESPPAPPAATSEPGVRLTWLGEFTRPAGAVYPTLLDSARFGELSGLVRDDESGQWVAVVDDRETRVAWLTIGYANNTLTVTPTRLMPLRAGAGVSARTVTQADLEAIVALPDGTFLMTEEGHVTGADVWQPVILHATRDGLVTDTISYPSTFDIQPNQGRGLRPNQGFESLTRLPNGHLVAGLEQPLLEDGDTASFGHGGRARLIELVQDNQVWRAGRQWTYEIEPTPRVAGFDATCGDGGGTGLVELLSLTDTTLLSLERSCIQNPQTQATMNPTQIFSVMLDGTEARKALVLDLGTLVPRLSPALRNLDNFEGMSFGPPSPDGGATILVVSDDNFRNTQRTAFLLFSIAGMSPAVTAR
jgi:hypothetical protein